MGRIKVDSGGRAEARSYTLILCTDALLRVRLSPIIRFKTRNHYLLWIALFASALIGVFSISYPSEAQTFSDGYIRSPRLGITFISSADHPLTTTRYQNALLLGAGWNRYPMYWNQIEPAPGSFNWAAYDVLAAADVNFGLQTDAILLGIPDGYRSGGGIVNLNAPIFADGTDEPAPGKAINPQNHWAYFVASAVNRYKPGGLLASQLRWTPGAGIRVWEAWNEPDLSIFWSAGVETYARLLKVTYLAVKASDTFARVMFAGLAYNNPDQLDWLDATLRLIAADPARDRHSWYFDIAAVHAYTTPRRSATMIRRMRQTLLRYGLSRPVWLNESGVPVWNDYPGPTWTGGTPEDRLYRGTMEEQAFYVIQSTALAWAAGADVVFFHQLYDDCGNQPGGTDFPPNNGELCGSGVCAGDGFGLFRNERGAACFSQHPQPGSPRPAAGALRLLSRVFGASRIGGARVVDVSGQAVVISFDRQTPAAINERLYVMWSRVPQAVNVVIPVSGALANVYTMNGDDYAISPSNGGYTIGLQPAQGGASDGAPYLMVEFISNGEAVDPALIHLEGLLPGSSTVSDLSDVGGGGQVEAALATLPPPVTAAPTTVFIPTVRPTTDPAFDITAPRPYMIVLPPVSPASFTLEWGAEEDGGIDRYIVWVRVDGGDWSPYLETRETSTTYTGTSGRRYEFAVWAMDTGGNWSENTALAPQAVTIVQ